MMIRRLFVGLASAGTLAGTYFINNRADEAMGTIWSYLDITPLGRQETREDSPESYPQTPPYKCWNWHDNYDAEASPDSKWVEVSDAGEAAFRKRDAEAKAGQKKCDHFAAFEQPAPFT
jgi:hypothetical protein